MQNAALRVAVKIGVLNLLSSPNLLDENKEIRLAQLAEHAHCDPELVGQSQTPKRSNNSIRYELSIFIIQYASCVS